MCLDVNVDRWVRVFITTVAGDGGPLYPSSVDWGHNRRKYENPGDGGPATSIPLLPQGVAVDASGNNGHITVKASGVKLGGRDAVRISVADDGKGIASENLQTIWEPYVTNKPGGTGLGLAIARQAVWAHDGTVNATSTLGKGTEIQFTIPANGAHAERID